MSKKEIEPISYCVLTSWYCDTFDISVRKRLRKSRSPREISATSSTSRMRRFDRSERSTSETARLKAGEPLSSSASILRPTPTRAEFSSWYSR
ncbi:MAG: hypothetical protein DMG07_20975 [Acidobacteria bacterium]|nr:MAG: hypothetical protein DMG07_20975 [Acidobacteriota bacterium]